MSNPQNHIEIGSRHTITITDIAFGGDGVGKLDGLTVFVPFVCEGEEIEIVITRFHKRFARSECLHVMTASPKRIEPRCPVYKQCAGCQYQHTTYDEQARIKTSQVRALFARIGRWPDAPVRDIIPAASPWNYRNRITLHGPGAPAYIGQDHETRVPITTCPIADHDINEQLAQWIAAHPEGLSEEQTLTLHSSGDRETGTNAWITQTVQGVPFQFPPGSFFQVHASMAEHLARDVVYAVRTSGASLLIDAYSGVGVFGLLAARDLQHVWCIESDQEAVRAARINAKQLDCSNVKCLARQVEDYLPELLQRVEDKNVTVILDPPRAGCSRKVLEALVKARVRRILYVSCAPDRLARDARLLLDGGYDGVWIQPYDMFPQTAHVEVLACFDRGQPVE